MDRALIFCTAHLQSDPSRYQLWAKYYAAAFKDHSVDLLMVNDGPCNPADKPTEAELIVLEPHLGRHSMHVFPGWKRSFAFALRTAMDRGYRWIGHVESDLYIKPHAIAEFIQLLHCENGYGSGWCRTYSFPEASLLVLNDHRINGILLERYSTEAGWNEDIDFEHMLWSLGPGRMLEGDRFEGHVERLYADDTYIAAIHFSELNHVSHLVRQPAFATVLLTTWNRPDLLCRSLPLILAECQRKRWPLLIADDRSTNSRTLQQLDAAVLLGATLVRRDYQRDIDANAHEMLQRNAMFGFQEAISRWPHNECILKLDDDIVLACGAFQQMQKGWARARLTTGNTLLEFSGIRTTAQRIVDLHDGFAITQGACNAAVLYATEDWRTAIEHADESFILQRGFDTWMSEEYGSGRPCATLLPSAFYHMGHFGVHGRGNDINIDYTEDA